MLSIFPSYSSFLILFCFIISSFSILYFSISMFNSCIILFLLFFSFNKYSLFFICSSNTPISSIRCRASSVRVVIWNIYFWFSNFNWLFSILYVSISFYFLILLIYNLLYLHFFYLLFPFLFILILFYYQNHSLVGYFHLSYFQFLLHIVIKHFLVL